MPASIKNGNLSRCVNQFIKCLEEDRGVTFYTQAFNAYLGMTFISNYYNVNDA